VADKPLRQELIEALDVAEKHLVFRDGGAYKRSVIALLARLRAEEGLDEKLHIYATARIAELERQLKVETDARSLQWDKRKAAEDSLFLNAQMSHQRIEQLELELKAEQVETRGAQLRMRVAEEHARALQACLKGLHEWIHPKHQPVQCAVCNSNTDTQIDSLQRSLDLVSAERTLSQRHAREYGEELTAARLEIAKLRKQLAEPCPIHHSSALKTSEVVELEQKVNKQ
jgi:hypothetical protein